MKKNLIILIVFLIISSCSNSQNKVSDATVVEEKTKKNTKIKADYSEKDVQIVSDILQKGKLDNWFKKELNEIVILVGTELLGTKYASGILDKKKEEQLIINIQALDCVTFVENCSVLASLIKRQKTNFDDYLEILTHFRYRNGKIETYTSRLHYFSDWLSENQKLGNIKLISEEIANTPKEINVFFISKNASKYPLLSNDSLINEMAVIEKEISARNYFYIHENEINKHKDKIVSGSIIGITTNIKGLDIVHTGIAIHVNGELHFMHASSRSMEVEISKKSLQAMLNANKIQTGIMIAKLMAMVR